VLESNRDLVLRRLVECLSRDRTKHQVAEVTSLGLVQMTRKKLGLGLAESFAELGGGRQQEQQQPRKGQQESRRRGKGGQQQGGATPSSSGSSRPTSAPSQAPATHALTEDVKNALSRIAASTIAHAEDEQRPADAAVDAAAAVEAAIDAAAAEAAAKKAAAGTASPGADDLAPGEGTAAGASEEGRGDDERRSRSGRRGRRGRGAQRDDAARTGSEGPEAPVAPAPEPAADVAPAATASGPAEVVDAPVADPAPSRRTGERRRATAEVTTPDASVAILDLPVAATRREPRRVSPDAEQLLGSVLDALPEPAQPGKGRSRSRRASSGGVTSAPAPGAGGSGDGPVILGAGSGSDAE